jgi:uncharacterized protein DUF3667
VILTSGTATSLTEPVTCPNCGAPITASYCPQCGQETSLALPTVRALLREAAGRYVALDGRLWRTMSALLFRPGFLTREYFAGRRRRYIRPARLFLVLSLALFAVMGWTGHAPSIVDTGLSKAEREEIARDEAAVKDDVSVAIGRDLKLHMDIAKDSWLDPLRSRAEAFNALPMQQKGEQLFAGVLRYGPYAMVALLPVFALLMKLVYLGRARRYPLRPRRYAAHLVFGAHSHAFLFLIGVLMLAAHLPILRSALGIWAVIYLLWSIKAVYGGRWLGVLARAVLIFFAYTICFGLAVAGLVVAAILLR